MNKVIMIGHLANDPELQYAGPERKAACSFRIAVRRRYSSADGNTAADFFWVSAWGKLAENATRYLHKGSRAAVTGQLRTRNWDGKDGQKHYTTEISADEIEFLSSGTKEQSGGDALGQAQAAFGAEFVQVEDDELPF